MLIWHYKRVKTFQITYAILVSKLVEAVVVFVGTAFSVNSFNEFHAIDFVDLVDLSLKLSWQIYRLILNLDLVF